MKPVSVMLLAAMALAGCQKPGPAVAGEWLYDYPGAKGSRVYQTMTLKPDGTLVDRHEVKNRTGSLITIRSGTWKAEGDQLTRTITQIGMEVTGYPEEKKKRVLEMHRQNNAMLLKLANDDATQTFKLVGPDEMTLVPSGKATETRFKRKK